MNTYLRDSIAFIAASLGVSFAWNIWAGGIALSVVGASVAFYHDPERDNRERWLVYLTAMVTAHIGGILGHWLWEELPPQLVMFGAGFMSRRIIRLALRVAGLVEARGDTIADRLVDRVLPGSLPSGGNRPAPSNPPDNEDEGQ